MTGTQPAPDWKGLFGRIEMNAAAIKAQAEEHLAKLEAEFAPYLAEYNRLADSIDPVLAKMHDLESKLDRLKPALHEARQLVAKLKG